MQRLIVVCCCLWRWEGVEVFCLRLASQVRDETTMTTDLDEVNANRLKTKYNTWRSFQVVCCWRFNEKNTTENRKYHLKLKLHSASVVLLAPSMAIIWHTQGYCSVTADDDRLVWMIFVLWSNNIHFTILILSLIVVEFNIHSGCRVIESQSQATNQKMKLLRYELRDWIFIYGYVDYSD